VDESDKFADREQLLQEDIARDIIATQKKLDELDQKLPGLIQRASDTKRDLEVIKAQIRYCRERIKGKQSVLKSLRP
jgi:peptidoglycan hydrolase CwlO-like protein